MPFEGPMMCNKEDFKKVIASLVMVDETGP